MHFQNLECDFSPGFLAEGRRGRAKKLENTLKMFEHTHFPNLYYHFSLGFLAEGRRGQTKQLLNMNMGSNMAINMAYIN